MIERFMLTYGIKIIQNKTDICITLICYSSEYCILLSSEKNVYYPDTDGKNEGIDQTDKDID